MIKTPEGERELEHGVTIMATGGQPYKPGGIPLRPEPQRLDAL